MYVRPALGAADVRVLGLEGNVLKVHYEGPRQLPQRNQRHPDKSADAEERI